MGELELIAAIERSLRRRGERVLVGPGDDASVVDCGGVAVTSVDTVVDRVHFERDTHSPADIGHKALASALSDLAAMGAHAGEAYVSLGLASDFGERDALELVAAMESLAARHDTTIAGGDVVMSPVLSVNVTVVGHAERADALVYRSGARPGDLVGVTGSLGGAAAGLELLRGLRTELESQLASALVRRQRRPEPQLAAGRLLADAGASALIDVSDGIAADAAHLAEASGAALEIELTRLPLDRGVEVVAKAIGRDPFEFAASAGDDYELLFAAAPARRAAIEATLGGAAWVGAVHAGTGLTLLGERGRVVELSGYEHAAGRSGGSTTPA